MSKEARPKAIDLFAGAGGLSLGFEQAGFDLVAAVEIDPIHCGTHAYNFPQTPVICEDVARLSGGQVRAAAQLGAEEELDVVIGGAPCQGFSLMGKRVWDDPRNQLVFHYVRLVAALQPKYCVFENVKGLSQGRHVSFLQALIAALGEAGYAVSQPVPVLNAADYGVPQDRQRLFLVGTRQGLPAPCLPPPSQPRVTVREAIASLPDTNQYPALQTADAVSLTWEDTAIYARQLRGQAVDPTDYSYPRLFDPDYLTNSRQTQHSAVAQARFLATPPGQREPVSRFHKLDPEGLCNTLRAGTDRSRGAFTSARPIHPLVPRVITVREAARLHSYPDWFRFHETKWHGFRQIGNSVPPRLARAVAQTIGAALGYVPQKPLTPLPPLPPELLRLPMKAAALQFGVDPTVIRPRVRR